MGLNASSDKWRYRSNVIIHGLPWARKIVDDTLIWAGKYAELIPRVKIVLDRCRQHNITISKKKLDMGSEINFASSATRESNLTQTNRNWQLETVIPRLTNRKVFYGVSQSIDELQPRTFALYSCLLYTSPSPRDRQKSRMPSSA